MKVIYIATVLLSFFLFTACGGSDCEGSECFEPTDETSVTDDEEVADNTTDETVDETVDEVVDEEPDTETPDEGNVEEICVNFLDREGKWSVIYPTAVSGEITIKLSVIRENCKITVSGKWEFSWEGIEIQQLGCPKEASMYSFFSLQEMEGEILVIRKSASEENCENGEGTPYKFEKIQQFGYVSPKSELVF